MRLLKAKSIIAGIATALLLAVGTLTSTAALADHSSQRHSQQRHYSQHHYKHHDNRQRLRHSRHHDNRKWVSKRHRSHNRLRHSNRSLRHNKRHRNNSGGHVYYRGNNIAGALVGGAIIYHLGRELSRH